MYIYIYMGFNRSVFTVLDRRSSKKPFDASLWLSKHMFLSLPTGMAWNRDRFDSNWYGN